MDVYCFICGEPWDLIGIQSDDFSDEERRKFWDGEGCPCCNGKAEKEKPFRSVLQSALVDIMGDDLDGIASGMDDAEYFFGDDFWD